MTEPQRFINGKKEHHVKIKDKDIVKEMMKTTVQSRRNIVGFSIASKSQNSDKEFKSFKPKVNIAKKNVACRVNTASGSHLARKRLMKHSSQKLLSRKPSNKNMNNRMYATTDILETLKSTTDKYNYQIAYGPNWGTTQFNNPRGFDDIGIAKRPKSRMLHSSVSVRNMMHQQRSSIRSQNMKRGVGMPKPYLNTFGNGLWSEL